MKKVVDAQYKIYDERHSFCFKCKPTLGEEDETYGQASFAKRNGRYVIADASQW
jgi:hypothetical protein